MTQSPRNYIKGVILNKGKKESTRFKMLLEKFAIKKKQKYIRKWINKTDRVSINRWIPHPHPIQIVFNLPLILSKYRTFPQFLWNSSENINSYERIGTNVHTRGIWRGNNMSEIVAVSEVAGRNRHTWLVLSLPCNVYTEMFNHAIMR